MHTRVGIGYDVHRLGEDRKLVIGGIHIPWHKGCIGYSDGDVLIHAICDAMLGAVSAGDIGRHFPDTSPEFKDIDSKILLDRTKDIIRLKGYQIGNIDSTVCLQKPKIGKYIPGMQEEIARILEISIKDISIKATTTERLGLVGREEGIAAYAVVMLEFNE